MSNTDDHDLMKLRGLAPTTLAGVLAANGLQCKSHDHGRYFNDIHPTPSQQQPDL